jgi:hypothetical protein
MDKEIVEAFKERLDVFDDSPEVVELLLPINDYAAQEAWLCISKGCGNSQYR